MNALSTNASMAYKQPTQKGTTITTQLHTFITHSFSSLDHSTLIYILTQNPIFGAVASVLSILKRLANVFFINIESGLSKSRMNE